MAASAAISDPDLFGPSLEKVTTRRQDGAPSWLRTGKGDYTAFKIYDYSAFPTVEPGL